ncbi:MAG: dephospho-CoA kinase [Rickettsiales bacterium]|nr:dephospho-CoA kinase [Rickettsiales bacterium]
MATVIGITGTIGSGKSYISKLFASEHGAVVYDADKVAKDIIFGSGAQALCDAFPEWVTDGKLDGKKLKADVLSDESKLAGLEAIIHPLVREEFARIRRATNAKDGVLVFEVPLLFEKKFEGLCDYTVTVAASPEVQHERVMARNKMTEEQLKAVLAKQLPQDEKIRRANFVIHNNGDHNGKDAVREVMSEIAKEQSAKR